MAGTVTRRQVFAAGAAMAAAPGARASDPPRRAGGPHLRVGCCAYSYRDFLLGGKKQPSMTLEQFLDRMAEIGIDGVELTSYYFPPDVTPEFINRLKRRCFQLGIDINGTAIGNTFTLPPGPERDKNIALVKTWVDHAVEMGAPCARVFAGAVPRGVSDEQARKWVIECVETCCDYAGKRGVMLAMENHGGVVAEPDGILAIMKAVNSEWFGMKWDCGNFRTADPYADLARCAPYALTTHIKTDLYPAGKKQPMDLARIVKILKDAGYRGYLHLEYEGAEDPLVAVPRTLKELLRLTAA